MYTTTQKLRPLVDSPTLGSLIQVYLHTQRGVNVDHFERKKIQQQPSSDLEPLQRRKVRAKPLEPISVFPEVPKSEYTQLNKGKTQ